MKTLKFALIFAFVTFSNLVISQTTTLQQKAMLLTGTDNDSELLKPLENSVFKKKSLSEGTDVKVVKVESNGHHEMVYVIAGKREGWVHRYALKDRSILIDFIPEIRKEYSEYIKKGKVCLGMNTEETLLTIGIPGKEVKTDKEHETIFASIAPISNEMYWEAKMYKNKLYYYSKGFLKQAKLEYKQTNEWELVNVEKPIDDQSKFSEIKTIDVQGEQNRKYSYEDENISIVWFISRYGFSFELKNKNQFSFKIPWDEMSYVDIYGKSNRLIHTGVKYADRNEAQPISIVPRNSTLEDLLTPSDNIFYLKQWLTRPLIEDLKCLEKAQDSGVIGKRIQIIFPIQIKDVTNEYTFIFELKDILFNPSENQIKIR